MTSAGNYVENCRIHDYNRIEKSYRPGIWMDGVGNRISKCDIYDAPSMAILFHGNNHVIELCDITNVCSEVDDQELFIMVVILRSREMLSVIVIFMN